VGGGRRAAGGGRRAAGQNALRRDVCKQFLCLCGFFSHQAEVSMPLLMPVLEKL
jgi:hypothetical protein